MRTLPTPTDGSQPLQLPLATEDDKASEHCDSPTTMAGGELASDSPRDVDASKLTPAKLKRPRTAPLLTSPAERRSMSGIESFVARIQNSDIAGEGRTVPDILVHPDSAKSRTNSVDTVPSASFDMSRPQSPADSSVGVPLQRVVTEPPNQKTAVDLHNFHASKGREQRQTATEAQHPGTWRSTSDVTVSRAASKRLGIGANPTDNSFGVESVRIMDSEKAEKPWRILGVDLGPNDQKAKAPKKIVGFFSRLKR